jgi:transcriptional regulator with PAS, ATPase and Fis domain
MNNHEKTQAYHRTDFLEAILDTSVNAIVVIDKHGDVLFTNSRFSDIWMFPKELLGKGEAGRLIFEYILDQLEEPEYLDQYSGNLDTADTEIFS